MILLFNRKYNRPTNRNQFLSGMKLNEMIQEIAKKKKEKAYQSELPNDHQLEPIPARNFNFRTIRSNEKRFACC